MNAEGQGEKWYVDRSRVEAGRRCARLRWLSFHAEAEIDEQTGLKVLGGFGRGLRTTAASLPLVTGTHTHSIFAALLLGEEPGKAIKKVVEEYRKQTAPFLEVVEEQARRGAEGDEALVEGAAVAAEEQRWIVQEQAWLVECLGWVLALYVVPRLLETWEVVEVETEAEFDLDPTIRFMPRPDAVLRHRVSGKLMVLDLKTSADAGSKLFMAQWQTTPQLNVACRGVALRHNEECSAYYVQAVQKGNRQQDKDWGEFIGPKKQQTALCYAFLRELPMQSQEWRISYYVPAVDGEGQPIINPKTGKQRKEGSTEKQGWRKVAVWEHARSAREHVEQLPKEFVEGISRLIGPVECKEWLIDSYEVGVRSEEWRVWIPLAGRMQEAAARGAGQEELHQILDELAPQSWDCTRFGRECEFKQVCLRVPTALEGFAPRVPHHEEERKRFEEIYGVEGVEEGREE